MAAPLRRQAPAEVFSSGVARSAFHQHVSPIRIMVVPPERAWRPQIVSRLDELCKLSRGWDGYCAEAVTFQHANFALSMLDSICPSSVPAPSIVPGPNGDLQVEWHLASCDIELHVRAPNDVHAWRLSADTDIDGEELCLTSNFSEVAAWIKALLEPTVATIAPAA